MHQDNEQRASTIGFDTNDAASERSQPSGREPAVRLVGPPPPPVRRSFGAMPAVRSTDTSVPSAAIPGMWSSPPKDVAPTVEPSVVVLVEQRPALVPSAAVDVSPSGASERPGPRPPAVTLEDDALAAEPPSSEDARAASPRRRKAVRAAMLCVAAAATAGAIGAAMSVRATHPSRDTPRESSHAGPPRAATANAAPAANVLPAPPVGLAAPSSIEHSAHPSPIVLEGSQHPTPSCDELIAAHPAPGYRLQPFDYLYLFELRTARREIGRGRLESAHAALCRASRAPGADNNVWLDLAHVLLLRRDGAAAVPWLERVLDLDPNDRRARALFGDALLGAGRVEEARAAWLKAASIRSADSAAVTSLSEGYFKMAEDALAGSHLPRAERFYRRTIALDPEHARARARLAALLTKLGVTNTGGSESALSARLPKATQP